MIENNEKGSNGLIDHESEAGKVSKSEDTKSTYPGEKREERPDELPFKHESEVPPPIHSHETELEQQDIGNDDPNGEQGDVTPPAPHEFPSFGNAKTDFVSRPLGRTTGRMVGHEPGTESI